MGVPLMELVQWSGGWKGERKGNTNDEIFGSGHNCEDQGSVEGLGQTKMR